MAIGTRGFVPSGNLNIDDEALEKSGQKAVIFKVLKLLKKYRLLILLSLAGALISVIFTLQVPIKIGNAIDSLTLEGLSFKGELLSAGVYALIVGISTYIMNLVNNKLTYYTVRDMRNEALSRIEKLPLRYIDSHLHGDMVSRVIADADQFADGLLMGFSKAFTGILTILGTLIFMFRMNVAISLVVVLVTPLSMTVAKFISSKTYEMFRLQSMQRGEQTGIIDEMIGNVKVVKAFSHEEKALDKFDRVNIRLGDSTLRAVFFSSLTNPCTRFVNAVCYALVALVGAYFTLNSRIWIFNGITVGTLTVFLSYANQYTKPFNEISSVLAELQNALACAARVFEITEASIEESDENGLELDAVSGLVDIKNVDFSYSKDKELITNLNLHIVPGQRVAIVGPTGCGKTTIINLLMRFYDVDSGSISVEEKDIRSLKRHSLRDSYGMVLQDTWLRKGTIMDNLRLAKSDATKEEVIRAAKLSHAHSFIRRLPEGYDTMLGEDGGSLSQGQKQLLCITRVMLNLPPMLILDEATSSIDTRTEIKIQKAFNTMMEGRTSFIVAHRLSTIQNADIILVMKDGHIIEQGTHEELLQEGGFYFDLYNSQFCQVSDDSCGLQQES